MKYFMTLSLNVSIFNTIPLWLFGFQYWLQ